MARFDVSELFPGATIEGMRAVHAMSRVTGRFAFGEGVRGISISEGDDGGVAPALNAEMRKGSGKGASIAVLAADLTETADGVRAIGTFGPGLQGLLGFFVMIGAIGMFLIAVYNLVHGDRLVYNSLSVVLSIVILRYRHVVARFLTIDDWKERDLASLLSTLHHMYDGANAPAVNERDENEQAP